MSKEFLVKLNKSLFFVCLFAVCVCICAMVHVWRSADSSWWLALFFYFVGPGGGTQV